MEGVEAAEAALWARLEGREPGLALPEAAAVFAREEQRSRGLRPRGAHRNVPTARELGARLNAALAWVLHAYCSQDEAAPRSPPAQTAPGWHGPQGLAARLESLVRDAACAATVTAETHKARAAASAYAPITSKPAANANPPTVAALDGVCADLCGRAGVLLALGNVLLDQRPLEEAVAGLDSLPLPSSPALDALRLAATMAQERRRRMAGERNEKEEEEEQEEEDEDGGEEEEDEGAALLCLLRGYRCCRRGAAAPALQHLTKAWRLLPMDADSRPLAGDIEKARPPPPRGVATTANLLAVCHARLDDGDEALRWLQRAHAAASTDTDAAQRVLLNLVAVHAANGGDEEVEALSMALASIEKSIEEGAGMGVAPAPMVELAAVGEAVPSRAQLLQRRARVAASHEMWSEAAEAYRRLLLLLEDGATPGCDEDDKEHEPSPLSAMEEFAMVLLKSGRAHDALVVCERVLETAPARTSVLLLKSEAAVQLALDTENDGKDDGEDDSKDASEDNPRPDMQTVRLLLAETVEQLLACRPPTDGERFRVWNNAAGLLLVLGQRRRARQLLRSCSHLAQPYSGSSAEDAQAILHNYAEVARG